MSLIIAQYLHGYVTLNPQNYEDFSALPQIKYCNIRLDFFFFFFLFSLLEKDWISDQFLRINQNKCVIFIDIYATLKSLLRKLYCCTQQFFDLMIDMRIYASYFGDVQQARSIIICCSKVISCIVENHAHF